MPITVALEDEEGRQLEFAVDDRNDLHQLLKDADRKGYVLVTGIDWYGYTTFNAVQIGGFLTEWERLSGAAPDGAKGFMKTISAMAKRVESEVHLYLRFIGD